MTGFVEQKIHFYTHIILAPILSTFRRSLLSSWRIFQVILFSIFIGCEQNEKEISIDDLPIQTSFKVEDFSSAEDCKNCHPVYFEEWSASMHAYSVTDPVWFKLQQSEQITHHAKGVELGDFCIQCHSPIASLTNAITDHENLDQTVMAEFPVQIREGVTCDVCHMVTHLPEPTDIQVDEQNYETTDFKYFTDGTRYGLLDNPQDNRFHENGYHPGYEKSEFCQNCHNFTVDGKEAEVTNFEWMGTAFEAMGAECQTCHMPLYEGKAAEDAPYRKNLHRHYFPGIGTSIVVENDEKFLSAIEALLDGSAEINFFSPLPDTIKIDDELKVKIIVSNNTGHNFPSGVTFTRQLWLEVTAIADGDTIFRSGHLNENGDISDFYIDPEKIIDPQLNVFNTVLYNEEGDSGIMAVSVEDMDWMNDYTLQVSSSRILQYSIALNGIQPENSSTLTVTARLRFRSLPPFLLRHLDLNEESERLIIWEIDEVSTVSVLE